MLGRTQLGRCSGGRLLICPLSHPKWESQQSVGTRSLTGKFRLRSPTKWRYLMHLKKPASITSKITGPARASDSADHSARDESSHHAGERCEANGNRKAEIHICARQRGSVAVRRRDWRVRYGPDADIFRPIFHDQDGQLGRFSRFPYVSLITLPFDPHEIFMCRIIPCAELICAGYCAHAVPRTTP